MSGRTNKVYTVYEFKRILKKKERVERIKKPLIAAALSPHPRILSVIAEVMTSQKMQLQVMTKAIRKRKAEISKSIMRPAGAETRPFEYQAKNSIAVFSASAAYLTLKYRRQKTYRYPCLYLLPFHN
jgi:hypothetical protein